MAKAYAWNGSDGEGRKLGERSGLDMGLHEELIELLSIKIVFNIMHSH